MQTGYDIVMAKRITVVISQGQSAQPDKRRLEESLVAGLLGAAGIEVVVVPHLYDLAPGSTGALCLEGIRGDMIVASWLFPRAAFWTLDRQGVRGREGRTQLAAEADEEDHDDEENSDGSRDADDAGGTDEARDATLAVESKRPTPDRAIYCLDLRAHRDAEPYLTEIRRIVAAASVELVSIGLGPNRRSESPAIEARRAPVEPAIDVAIDPTTAAQAPAGFIDLFGAASAAATMGLARVAAHSANGVSENGSHGADSAATGPTRIAETAERRWYPVIDYSRCTNCMECIDFCLFGVYGVDRAEMILVEQPDNCRKGCPACSRVCPANAIMFPQHKTPAIAGSEGEAAGGIKIDLSQLFGAPSAVELAAQERDVELVAVGRDAVGLAVGIPKRQADKPSGPKDDLDALMDELDAF